jgi:hypothetical protein
MTGQKNSRIGAAILLALLFAVAFALFLSSDGAEAQTNPPSTGDWNIYDSTTLSDQQVTVPGALNIYSGGSLTLTNVDLTFNHASWGSKAFRVRSNARLTMTGGSVGHTSTDYSYQFVLESGSIVKLDGVTIKHTWHDSRTYVNNQDLNGGMQVRSHQVTVINCTFTQNERVAMTIHNANPKITDTLFTKTAYYSYYRSYSYLDREAYGIVVLNGAPEITGCIFDELGDYSTAYNDAGTYTYTYLSLNGHGIYVVRGSPKVSECTFTEIGRMHTSSTLYTYVPSAGRYVYFYFYRQQYRGAIHAIDPLLLEVTKCNFTNNYQGYYYYTSQAYGIYQNDGKSSIKENIFISNGGGGMYIYDGDTLFKDNYIGDFSYYGFYIQGKGAITAQNNTFNGTMEMRNVRNEVALYIYNGGSNIDIRQLHMSFLQRAIYVTDTNLVKVYDTIIVNSSKKIYANAARVDCFNVTVSRADIEMGWSTAEVNIHWKLDVKVTWQNGSPIPAAIVQIFNESNGLLKANKANDVGRMPTLTLLQTKIVGFQQSQTSTVNSPLKISAYANAIESDMYTVPFDSNTFFNCIIEDKLPPNVEIYAPMKDHAQNETTLRLFGIAVDVGSGLDGVEVSVDDGENWHRATGGLTWNLSLELEEGVYDVIVRGVDSAGATSDYPIKNVTIDLTKPWLIITTPARDFFYTNQTSVTIIGQAEIGAGVFLNGVELPTTGGSFFTQLSDQQEGLNTYEVMAVDLVGNRNITLLRIFQDITPPILLVEHPPEEHVTNDRVLVISGLTERDVIVTIDELPVTVANGLFTMPITLKEGLNVIEINAVDLAQNHKHMTLRVTYDITPPVLNMVYPLTDGSVNKSTVTVAGSVQEDVREVLVNKVPVVVRQREFTKNFKLSEGNNLIVVEVTDLAGNSISRTFDLLLDTDPPELLVEGPEDLIYVTSETVSVWGRAEVGATVTINQVEVLVTGGYFSYEAPLEETPPGGDPNVIVILAMDDVGNEISFDRLIYRDTIAPEFTVYETGSTTRADFINITGAVEDVTDIHVMTINGLPVQPSDRGFFEVYVPLAMGENVFLVKARDVAGNEYTQEVMIERRALQVADTGFLGLGDSSWLVMVLFLVVGLTVGLAALYILERRKGVVA